MTKIVKDGRGHVHVYLGDDVPVGATVKINMPGVRGHGETGKVLSKRDGHLQIQSGPNENTNYMIPEGKVRVVSSRDGAREMRGSSVDERNRWLKEGREAKKAGKPRSENPYREGSEAAQTWANGYNSTSDTSSGPFSGSRALRRSGKVSLIEGDGDDRGYFGVRVEGKGTKAFNRRSDADAYFDECVAKYGKTEDADAVEVQEMKQISAYLKKRIHTSDDAFKIGQKVVSTESVQGTVKGQTYTVTSKEKIRNPFGGSVTRYQLDGRLWIVNEPIEFVRPA